MWDWLKTANIEVSCPPEIGTYIREKMSKERPYQIFNKR
jgi:hypothetical protein